MKINEFKFLSYKNGDGDEDEGDEENGDEDEGDEGEW